MLLSKNLYKLKLTKQKIYIYSKNNVEKFKIRFEPYGLFIKDLTVINYFKRFYPFQRLTKIEGFLKRSKFYNRSFVEKVAGEIKDSKATFLKNLKKAVSLMSNSFKVHVSENEHSYAVHMILKRVFVYTTTTYRPSLVDLVTAMNLTASAGMPKPWVKKKHLLQEIAYLYNQVSCGKLDLVELVSRLPAHKYPYTSAFVRQQITNTGLKVRLVFAVSLVFVVVETYFNLILKYVIYNVNSTAIHGYTQIQIRDLVKSTNKYHVLCIDYKSFDQTIPSFVILTVTHIACNIMRLSQVENKLFFQAVSFFITMPIFHPLISPTSKSAGITSGSGFTSIFGSLCNSYMLNAAIYRYCKTYNIKEFENNYRVYCSSDDTIISSSFKIDFNKFEPILKSMFGVEIELESYSLPGRTEAFFLGSYWVNNLPTRNVDRMLARILFGSGDIPPFMTDEELLQSRCYEILGNTSQYSKIYDTFGVPYPKKVFRFLEIADYNARTFIMQHRTEYEKRGIHVVVNLSRETADEVWKER